MFFPNNSVRNATNNAKATHVERASDSLSSVSAGVRNVQNGCEYVPHTPLSIMKHPDTPSKDKQQVEQYKANIKAQLTRKGLIRGQPRASLLQAQGNTNLSQQNSSSRPPAYHRFSAPADSSSNNSISNSLRPDHDFGLGFGFVDSRQNSLPGVAGEYYEIKDETVATDIDRTHRSLKFQLPPPPRCFLQRFKSRRSGDIFFPILTTVHNPTINAR